jgi:virginiamycin B lyase
MKRQLSWVRWVLASGLVLLVAGASPVFADEKRQPDTKKPRCRSECITEYQLPPASAGPFGIVTGPDRAIWFSHGDTIGWRTLDGQTTDFPVPTPKPLIGWLHVGPDRAIWFAERGGNKIGRITRDGTVTEYAIPTASGCEGEASSVPQGITTGRDGNLWFTEECGNKIGRLTLDGVITEYAVPTPDSGLLGITAGPDGALWFVERNAEKIGRITLAGQITEFALSPGTRPQRITVGADRALWFSEFGANKIGRLTTDGTYTEYDAPGGPVGITVGPDKALWFVAFTGNSIGRMNLAGQVTHTYAIPTPQSGALQITVGPDRALWFTEGVPPDGSRNALGRVQPFKGRHCGQASVNTGAASRAAPVTDAR